MSEFLFAAEFTENRALYGCQGFCPTFMMTKQSEQ